GSAGRGGAPRSRSRVPRNAGHRRRCLASCLMQGAVNPRVEESMALRSAEPDRIRQLRTAHGAQVSLAERVLDFAHGFFAGTRVNAPDGDAVAVVLVSFQVKIVAILRAIIVLAERGLPTSSLARELLEAVISVAYIAAGDSAERARLYVDYLIVRDWKD